MDVKLIVYIVYSYWLSDFKALVLNWGGTLSVVGKTCWLQTDRTRYTQRDVFFLCILHFCSTSCELVPSFSMMLEAALCVHEQKPTGCWGKCCRGRAAVVCQVSSLLSPLFCKVIYCSKKNCNFCLTSGTTI